MYWYYAMIGFVSCGVVLPFERNRMLRQYLQTAYFVSILLVLVIFIGLRSNSPDYDSYTGWFDSIAAGGITLEDWGKDPAFVFISRVVLMAGFSFIGVALIFAVAALVAQLQFSSLASVGNRWIILFFFLVVCRTFVGSDMASIRSAVAIPLMSISIMMAFRGKRKIALLIYIVALTFHLSVLIGFLPFVLAMSGVQFCSRWWVVSVALGAIAAKVCLENLLVYLSVLSRATPYVVRGNSTPTMYFVYIAARVLLIALVMVYWWKGSTAESRMVFFCYSIGIAMQAIFIFNNALSWRSSDIFALFDVCVLMMPMNKLRGKMQICYAAGLVVLGFVYVCASVNILDPYRWVFA